MKHQTSFFDQYGYPQPAHQMTETSHAAAKSLDKAALTEAKAAILKALSECQATADELAAKLGLSVLYVRPRIADLKRARLIEDSGVRRANISGKKAAVWRVTV